MMSNPTDEKSLIDQQGTSDDAIFPVKDHQGLLADVLELVSKAGQLAVRGFGESLPELKTDGSYVTDQDKAGEKVLRGELEGRFPDHRVLGEEDGISGNDSSPFLWALDPIDGTSNYVNGVPFWGTPRGLVAHPVPVLGILNLPMQSQTFRAIKGECGSWNRGWISVPLRVEMRSSGPFGVTAGAIKE